MQVRNRTSERASVQAKERAWGEQTIREKWGEREHSLTVSFSSRAFLEMPSQATRTGKKPVLVRKKKVMFV